MESELKTHLDETAGFNQSNETLMLWYELSFLRFLSFKFFDIDIDSEIDRNMIIESSKKAQEFVKNRFPNLKINFHEKKMDSAKVEGKS